MADRRLALREAWELKPGDWVRQFPTQEWLLVAAVTVLPPRRRGDNTGVRIDFDPGGAVTIGAAATFEVDAVRSGR